MNTGRESIQMRTCLPAPPAGHSSAETYDEPCARSTFQCDLFRSNVSIVCGDLPDTVEGRCRYVARGDCAPN
ncbi:MAG: hypothetical protein ABW133_22830 [Polyangiaceae bacterium]